MARVTGSSQPSTVHDTACSTMRCLAATYAAKRAVAVEVVGADVEHGGDLTARLLDRFELKRG